MSDSTSTTPQEPEAPRSLLDKLGAALPVGLTALATIFASMSNGALQEAMYWKSQAAQDQSKSTNQWTLAGFKRDRALVMQATTAQLHAISGYVTPRFDTHAESGADVQKALVWLTEPKPEKGGLPVVKLPEVDDEIQQLHNAIEKREAEQEILKRAGRMKIAKITQAIDAAEKFAEQTDKEWEPVLRAANRLVRAQMTVKSGSPDAAAQAANATAAQAAGFDLEERRYRAESRLNQGIGFLYEVRTRVSSAESDKYRKKSDFLFYAMLVAQIGAVVSSLALARQRRSFLWLCAAMVGVIALGVGGYAFLPAVLLSF